jgi:acetylornithine deacetylase/succinyl-diaminopimelate desuccinylase-like protein
MRISRMAAAAAALAMGVAPAFGASEATGLRPDQIAFRALYKELVETNTTLSAGDCTVAAQRMIARLKAAGYPDEDVHLIVADGHPKEGGLVAVFHGSDRSAKAILILAHIDVVEARRADWQRDPFTLVKENGYFYARGASDDKAMASVGVDTLIRFRQEGFRPKRDIKLALTCGEETASAFNGAQYLATHHRDLIDAAFALNEGAGGRLDADGRPVSFGIQAGEKFPEDYQLEVTNPGGHSSRPVRDNAIYHLAGGLSRLMDYEFPVELNDATRGYFSKMADVAGGETGSAMRAIVANSNDAAANAIVSRDPSWHSMLRTTCVATMISGGHATNALPQRATANVNCRIFPGHSIEEVRAALEKLVADPAIKVTALSPRSSTTPPAPPLTPQIMGPVNQVAGQMWPGVPIIPAMSTGATDGVFLNAVGIPTYGLTGMFGDPDGNGVHGLNERIRVKSLYDGREFLYRVIKLYANG